MFMFVNFKPLTYNKTYTYPAWAQGMGMCLAFSSMICIPAYFCIQMLITPGSIKQVCISIVAIPPYDNAT